MAKTMKMIYILIILMLVTILLTVTAYNPFEDNYYLSGSEEQPIEKPIIKRTVFTDTINNLDGTYTTHYYTGQVNILNENNEYVPFEEFVDVSISDGNVVMSRGDKYSVSFMPIFEMANGNQYLWSDIPIGIEKDLWKKEYRGEIKYGVDFNFVPDNIKNNLHYVILHRTGSSGLTWDDVKIEGNSIIVKDKVEFSHEDILRAFTIESINKTDIVIGNLTENFIANNDGTWNISFDPTIAEYNTSGSSPALTILEGSSNDGFDDCDVGGAVNWIGTGKTVNIDSSEPFIDCMGTLTDVSTDADFDVSDDSAEAHQIDDAPDNGGGWIIVANLNEPKGIITQINWTVESHSDDLNDLWVRHLLWNVSGSEWFQCAAGVATTSDSIRHCWDTQSGYVFDSQNFINSSSSIILAIMGDNDRDNPGVIDIDYLKLEVTYSIYNMTIKDPTTSNPESVSDGDTITITFNYTESYITIPSGVTVENVTIGTSEATILDLFCAGTLACSAYTTETSCENCSECYWTPTRNEVPEFASFESASWDGWTDGGADAELDDGDGDCEDESVQIDDDSSSSYIQKAIDLSNYSTSVDINFSYKSHLAIDQDECIFLKCDGNIVSSWGTDSDTSTCANNMGENSWLAASAVITNGVHCTFDSSVIIRFEGEASTDGELFWLDCINVSGIGGNECENGGVCSSCLLNECDTNCSSAGCSVSNANYTVNGWITNVTVPSGLSGLQDLFIIANFSNVLRNDTQTEAISYAAVEDTTAPTYTANTSNTTTPDNNEWVSINITWTDDNVALAWFGNNFTGTWINDTPRSYTSGLDIGNATKFTAGESKIGCYYAYANDTSSNLNQTTLSCITSTVVDTTPPNINISSPINSTTYTTTSVDLNWSIDETPIWCAYSLDGGSNNTEICYKKKIVQLDSLANSSVMNEAWDVFVLGNYTYVVAYGSNGLTIFNTTEKNNIVQLSNFTNSSSLGSVRGVFVVGNYAYLTGYNNDALTIMNVTDKKNPVQIVSFTNASSLDGIYAVYVIGDIVYTVSEKNTTLTLINISDKRNPTQISSFKNATSLAKPYELYVVGDYTYSTSRDDDSMTIINVSDKTNPVQVGTIKNATSMDGASAVYVSGNYAYVTDTVGTYLTIIDVSDKTNPIQVAAISNSTTLPTARSIFVSGDYAYVASEDYDGISIFDISNKTNPTQINSFTNSTSMNGASSIYMLDDYAYVVARYSTLTVLNTSMDMENVTLTGLVDGSHNVTIWGEDTAGNMGQSDYVYWNISDTCTPGAADWIIQDTCIKTSDIDHSTYNIVIDTGGRLIIENNAVITAKQWNITLDATNHNRLNITPGARINVTG